MKQPIDKIVIEWTIQDMNSAFEVYLEEVIPNRTERQAFKEEKDAFIMLYSAFQDGWKLWLKMAIKSIEKYNLYSK